MATQAFTRAYIETKRESKEDFGFTDSIISYISKNIDEEVIENCDKIFKQTTMSIKSFANVAYKSKTFLDIEDINQIKESLANYANKDERVSDFKNAIIEDLTEMQKQIKVNYKAKLDKLRIEKHECQKQITVVEFEKNKLIMDRLSKIQWPYDEKTKEYDIKIALLTLKTQKIEQKFSEISKTRPSADEKEILMYQLKLKEKYSK